MLSVAHCGIRSGLHCLCCDERGMLCMVQQQRWARAQLPEQWRDGITSQDARRAVGLAQLVGLLRMRMEEPREWTFSILLALQAHLCNHISLCAVEAGWADRFYGHPASEACESF